MKNIKNIHPGVILNKEFLKALNISAYKLSKELKISQTTIYNIVKGKSCINASIALRLSKYFGNTPNFWLGLQNDYDLEKVLKSNGNQINKIKSFNKNIITTLASFVENEYGKIGTKRRDQFEEKYKIFKKNLTNPPSYTLILNCSSIICSLLAFKNSIYP